MDMDLPETTRVIAIFGASRVGKTTLAKVLGNRLELPVRHCGDAVRARASYLGVAPENLLLVEHRALDADTRRVASEGQVVIEGRYLDAVLVGVTGLRLFRLVSTDVARVERSKCGLPDRDCVAACHLEDRRDEKLRSELYGDIEPLKSWLTLDTTVTRPEELTARILAAL